jgi:serine/threonine protein kinase
MAAVAGACLGDETIAAMLEGALAGDAVRRAREHITTCDACRSMVSAAIDAEMPASASAVAYRIAGAIGPGSVIAGRYQIERPLGEGGMGRVYVAHQHGLERRVAIKILRSELSIDHGARARFHREAKLIASLASEHVVRVHDLGELDTGEPYIVMELLDGEDLAALVARGPIPVDQARAWILAACSALAEAHALGIVHRDIKPSNLFVTRQGRLVVLDFGIAKVASRHAGITGAGMLIGSPQYMSPEQITGANEVGAGADIWSIGATLYHLVVGRPPFTAPTLDALFSTILTGPPCTSEGLPPDVAYAVTRSLERDPYRRFTRIDELANALRAPVPRMDSRYQVVEQIGAGGHGVVYRARMVASGRDVALKVLRADAITQRDRFAREAAIVQRLQHPNTVRMFESGLTADGTPYMAFELVTGRTLADELARNGPMPPWRIARIAAQVLKALMEAHAHGIVHRDVTPANILLVDHAGEPDFVKLFDFGVATFSGPALESARLTTTNQLVGTPRYMAPEQVIGAAVDQRVDLYALGLVMAEAITGRPVVDVPTAMAACVIQASPEPLPLSPAVTSGPLGAVVGRATWKPAAHRFASAADMLAALEEAQRAPAPAPQVVRSRPGAAVWIAGAALLAGVIALLVIRPWSSSSEKTVAASASPNDTDKADKKPTPETIERIPESRILARMKKLGYTIDITRTDNVYPKCKLVTFNLEKLDVLYEVVGIMFLDCEDEEAATENAMQLRKGYAGYGVWIEQRGAQVFTSTVSRMGMPKASDGKALLEKILAEK